MDPLVPLVKDRGTSTETKRKSKKSRRNRKKTVAAMAALSMVRSFDEQVVAGSINIF
jgi:hypothetical protein